MDIGQIRDHAKGAARHPRTRKIAIWVVSTFVAIGVLFGLVAPPLIRGKVASALSDKFHRQVSIEQIKINPYAMSLTVRGFLMNERQSTSPAVSFDELYVNLELQSIFRLAPVLKELPDRKALYQPDSQRLHRKYNFQDLIEEFTSGPPGPTPRVLAQQHRDRRRKNRLRRPPGTNQTHVEWIKIGVPFISTCLPTSTSRSNRNLPR